ncbi:GNAT family N-acetyltransferase [Geodermatophilus sp. FMUSA9-8]|uniref:GNAT family N-acetyltransferase n=1 Tax=Geodermatophilus sp. FMUSA9-8 TaxID=3120155 RepID=UPI003008AECD
MSVRDATPADAAACRDVYAPYVTGTAVSFETDPPTAEEMARRIAAAQERHAWLVLDDGDLGGGVRGYAYGGPSMARDAYRFACTVSVYLEPGRRRTGAGRALYTALLDRLAGRGYRRVLAGVTLPNEASLGLHRALGFTDAGTYRRVGWKDGAWHDVAWLQRDLGPGPADAPPSDPPSAEPS